MNHYERLKEQLKKINVKKKEKKRVTDTRLHLTQYISHVIPLSSQRLILSPFNRSALLTQIGCNSFKTLFNIKNPTPLNILKGSYERFGFLNLWKGTTSHILSGVIFPGFYILSKCMSNLTYIPHGDKRRNEYLKRYLELLSICSVSHLFSYPFDTGYTRLASNYKNNSKIRAYLRETWKKRGIKNIYAGFSLCLLSTATHLLITIPLDQNMQYRVINSINEEIAKNPILNSNIKTIKPKELKPVELFPFNLIFATISSFLSRTITYPINTLKVKYQYHTYSENCDYRNFMSMLKKNNGLTLKRLYSGFGMKCCLFLPECLLYGTLYSAVVKFLS
ncbi:hypothetical protein MACK_000995 [Theileria orientalis]|uniref:Mitochondrial carrier protein n=1 Tax=Theileria orientalis TaxID=68886 RepID=A0A976MAY6_THEOR|nr:hypothetical protein MACK_000995 [Theileria orientalis]